MEYVLSSLELRRTKVVGEPDEGKPHVRFDVAGNGNQDMVKVLRHSQQKWRETDLPHLTLRRHSLTLPINGVSSSFMYRFKQIFSNSLLP